jgi:hypothetical protein
MAAGRLGKISNSSSNFKMNNSGKKTNSTDLNSIIWADGLPTGKTFVFDIDGVIASIVPTNDYALAGPLVDNIRRLNRLFEAGNTIILFTARGTMTGIDWSEVTQNQMIKWGVKYHRLQFGKPAADYYIDDKMIGLNTLAYLDRIV